MTLYKGNQNSLLTELVLVSSVQNDKDMSPELEAALWTLAEQASLEPEEQEKLFILLSEYADVLRLVLMGWAELIFFGMRFIREMHRPFVKNFVESVLRKHRKLKLCYLRCLKEISLNLLIVHGHCWWC